MTFTAYGITSSEILVLMTAAKQKNEKLLYFQTLIIHYIEYTIGYLHNQLYCFFFAFKENRLNI